jgi:penicillin G amidase
MRLSGTLRSAFDSCRRAVDVARGRRRPTVLELAGLSRRVEVLTDTFGVAHIFAETTHDLFFAQGYVTARDRLFQIDFSRMAASGRLSEMIGRRLIPWRETTVHLKERTTLDADVFIRTFGLSRAAAASLPLLPADAREVLDAFAAGVNAYIATGNTSLEHRIMRWTPEPWRAVDSLTLLRGIGFELNGAWRASLFGALLAGANVPDELAAVLWPHYPRDASTAVEGEAWAEMARELLLDREAANAILGFGNASGVGSNCFAVAGTHTVDGGALLANDTHLTLQAPSSWHEIHLAGGGFDLHGFALAGLPGIGIGRTPHHAWGITAGLVQDLDLYVERLHESDPGRYLTPSGYAPLAAREEVYHVRGERTQVRTIYESRHGPLLETLATRPGANERFAVCWTGAQAGRDFSALLGMWRARSLAEFDAALRDHLCPTFNIVYAGADGRIAYRLAGTVPRRKKGTPLRPLPGWTGEWDWDGAVPFEHNPRIVEPSSGFIVSANTRVAPWDYPYELGGLFEPPERYDRITARLAALGDRIAFEDLVSIQLDTYSAWGLRTRDALIAAAGGKGELNPRGRALHQAALELWLGWDGYTGTRSGGAAVAMVTSWNSAKELLRRLAGDDAAFGFVELASYVCVPLLDATRAGEAFAAFGVDLGEVVRIAFDRAVAQCEEAMGPDAGAWAWGRMHSIVAKHRLHGTLVGPLFDIGPEPAPGAPDTVNRGDLDGGNSFRVRVGASMRIVASAKDRDRAGTVMPGGQSGNRLSSHYDDQLSLFLSGRLKPASISKELIAVASREELWPRG